MKNPTNLGVSDNSSNWHLEQPRPGAQPRRYRIQLSLLGLRNLQAMGNKLYAGLVFSCDRCHRELGPGALLHGCRVCDYDLVSSVACSPVPVAI